MHVLNQELRLLFFLVTEVCIVFASLGMKIINNNKNILWYLYTYSLILTTTYKGAVVTIFQVKKGRKVIVPDK